MINCCSKYGQDFSKIIPKLLIFLITSFCIIYLYWWALKSLIFQSPISDEIVISVLTTLKILIFFCILYEKEQELFSNGTILVLEVFIPHLFQIFNIEHYKKGNFVILSVLLFCILFFSSSKYKGKNSKSNYFFAFNKENWCWMF